MAITFDNIDSGELAEKFSMALAQIGRNILDPNMAPEAPRGMTINLKFKPNKAGTIQVDYDITGRSREIRNSIFNWPGCPYRPD